MEDHQLNNLIKKYINGTATAAEREDVLQWYRDKADEAAELPYHNLSEEEAAKSKMLNNMLGQINKPAPSRKKRTAVWYSAAAAILIFLTIGGIFVLKNRNNPTAQLAGNIIKTSRGEHKKIILADGSVIWLSAESSVSYPAKFDGATREISFEGEAFFDIAKDKAHPFIVHYGATSVRVLGTTFNINAYKTHPDVTVSLITGKVSFSAGKSTHPLLPGHKIIYTKSTGNISVGSIANVQTLIARREGLYEYKNVRVEDVIEDISRNFNIKARAEGPVKDSLFYGRIKPGESPGKFLQKLAKVVNAGIIKVNDVYVIKEGGSN